MFIKFKLYEECFYYRQLWDFMQDAIYLCSYIIYHWLHLIVRYKLILISGNIATHFYSNLF